MESVSFPLWNTALGTNRVATLLIVNFTANAQTRRWTGQFSNCKRCLFQLCHLKSSPVLSMTWHVNCCFIGITLCVKKFRHNTFSHTCILQTDTVFTTSQNTKDIIYKNLMALIKRCTHVHLVSCSLLTSLAVQIHLWIFLPSKFSILWTDGCSWIITV